MRTVHKKIVTLVGLSVLTIAGLARGTARAQELQCNFPLDFGTIINCAGAGTVTVRPEGGSSLTGCIGASPGGVSRGSCVVSQDSLPVDPVQVSVTSPSYNINNGPNTMVVDNFNLQTNNGGTAIVTTTLAATIDIGARLNVGANQASGSYSGTVTINAVLQ